MSMDAGSMFLTNLIIGGENTPQKMNNGAHLFNKKPSKQIDIGSV